jgi:hypothetical protein
VKSIYYILCNKIGGQRVRYIAITVLKYDKEWVKGNDFGDVKRRLS